MQFNVMLYFSNYPDNLIHLGTFELLNLASQEFLLGFLRFDQVCTSFVTVVYTLITVSVIVQTQPDIGVSTNLALTRCRHMLS
jgi:hypothetical protein